MSEGDKTIAPDRPFGDRVTVDPCPTCGLVPTGYAPVIAEGREYRPGPITSFRDGDRVVHLVLRPCNCEIPTFTLDVMKATVTFPPADQVEAL